MNTHLVTYHDSGGWGIVENAPVHSEEQAKELAKEASEQGKRNVKIWQCIGDVVPIFAVQMNKK